ncbi:energy transducer TonB [Pedobacter frigoris]|uniref:Energy transducer TonB n=1 Tax=Pedobacter frigoris TaxID=2571272 RepID=A0A4U1CGA6_9SPHI|nr:energy transducer TonB [Pedobacter frigoris]TKC06242.1 energy transducer TonB [Pedobacter frigoris]
MLNISSSLYKSEWLDLVFKNRNQNYGAYALRAQSAGTTTRALFIAGPLFILLFAGPLIYKHLNPTADIVPDQEDTLTFVEVAPPIHEMTKPEEMPMPKAEPLKEKIKTVALPGSPVVVNHEVVTDPPTLEEVKNAAIGPTTQDGLETNIAVAPAVGHGNGTGTGSANGGEGTGVDNGVHELEGVEIFPEFEGGMKAWAKFIQRNMRYPDAAQERGLQGKVFISFVIEKDGSVSNVTIIKGIGGGCDEEATRVIKKSPRWKPGRQNNQNVRVRYQMPLSFAIQQ